MTQEQLILAKEIQTKLNTISNLIDQLEEADGLRVYRNGNSGAILSKTTKKKEEERTSSEFSLLVDVSFTIFINSLKKEKEQLEQKFKEL